MNDAAVTMIMWYWHQYQLALLSQAEKSEDTDPLGSWYLQEKYQWLLYLSTSKWQNTFHLGDILDEDKQLC